MGSRLKFLIDCRLEAVKTKRKKIKMSGLISLFMKVTISGTQGMYLFFAAAAHLQLCYCSFDSKN
jgi:hypothetical protein